MERLLLEDLIFLQLSKNILASNGTLFSNTCCYETCLIAVALN
jgi:hypothetical protein